MGDGAEKLHGVALLLKWEIRLRLSQHRHGIRLHFPLLSLPLGGDDFSVDGNGGARSQRQDRLIVAVESGVGYNLQIGKAASVIDFDEGECL